MTDLGVLNKLYSKSKTALEFNFDQLWAPSIYNFLSIQDIIALNEIATSTKLSAKINLKYDLIDRIMNNRGFKKFAAGTNRVVYSYLEDESFVVKIAIDRVGLKDNPAEFYNQIFLQPFITKCFEVTPCGTVGVFERVQPIINKQEFASIADDVFNIIVFKLVGKYVVDDFGSKYFMNWGLRRGFGPCLLDYPYVFELDSDKLYCNQFDEQLGTFCGGVIDYDSGFNDLVCTKCGKKYNARDLEKAKQNNLVITGGSSTMKVKLIKNDGTVVASSDVSHDYIKKPAKVKKEDKKETTLKVRIIGDSDTNPKITSIEDNAIIEENIVIEEKDYEDIIKKDIMETNEEDETDREESEEVCEESTSETNEEDETDREKSKEVCEDDTKAIGEDIEAKEEPVVKDEESDIQVTEEKKKKAPKRDSKGRFIKMSEYYNDEEDYEDFYDKKDRNKNKNHRRNNNLDKF